MNELVEPPDHLISSDEQDPGTTPVTESPSTSTQKSSLKKMNLAKIKEFQYGPWKSGMKLKYPMMENMQIRMRAKTAARTMDLPFHVTERMTLSSVSSR
jgi:hypothetical protein